MSNEAAVYAFLRNIDKSDPALYNALIKLASDFYEVYNELNPPPVRSRSTGGTVSSVLADVTNFVVTAFPANLRMSWDVALNAASYEIRMGATWETATPILTTNVNVANFDPIQLGLVYGNYIFWIKSIDSSGFYSANATFALFSVPQIEGPVLTINVISNNVLLNWTPPTSTWQIKEYVIEKDQVEIARISGTFKIQVETQSGSYSYRVYAIDIVGNESDYSFEFTVAVSNPIDYVRIGEELSTYAGTYTNTLLLPPPPYNRIIGPVFETENWQTHFTANSAADIQDLIDAGYVRYFEPSDISDGSYVEVFDFGAILSSVTVSCLFNKVIIGGATLTVTLEASDDDITYGTPVVSASTFFSSVRYVRVTIDFDAVDADDVSIISELAVVADAQFTTDSGVVSALASHGSTGTPVSFSVSYKSIDSIVLSVESQQPIVAIYTNVSLTGFNVLAFDNSGNQIDADVKWIARGLT